MIIGDEDDTSNTTSSNKNDDIIDQQMSLWGASSGIEWQGINTLSYHVTFY